MPGAGATAAKLAALSLLAACSPGEVTEQPSPAGAEPAAEQSQVSKPELLQQLGAIGYVSGGPELSQESGVLHREPGAMAPGLTLYLPAMIPVAYLVDSQGQVRHSWQASFEDVFPSHPDYPDYPDGEPDIPHWRHAEVLPDGSLLALWHLHGFFKLDRDSRVLWARPIPAHHDFHLADDGTAWVMTLDAAVVEDLDSHLLRLDSIDHLDAEG